MDRCIDWLVDRYTNKQINRQIKERNRLKKNATRVMLRNFPTAGWEEVSVSGWWERGRIMIPLLIALNEMSAWPLDAAVAILRDIHIIIAKAFFTVSESRTRSIWNSMVLTTFPSVIPSLSCSNHLLFVLNVSVSAERRRRNYSIQRLKARRKADVKGKKRERNWILSDFQYKRKEKYCNFISISVPSYSEL